MRGERPRAVQSSRRRSTRQCPRQRFPTVATEVQPARLTAIERQADRDQCGGDRQMTTYSDPARSQDVVTALWSHAGAHQSPKVRTSSLPLLFPHARGVRRPCRPPPFPLSPRAVFVHKPFLCQRGSGRSSGGGGSFLEQTRSSDRPRLDHDPSPATPTRFMTSASFFRVVVQQLRRAHGEGRFTNG